MVSGKLKIVTFHADTGFSSGAQFIEVPLQLQSVTPPSTGSGGGEVVKINGAGFNSATSVMIGDVPCNPRLITYDIYACDAPAQSAGDYGIKVNDVMSDFTITYTDELAPVINTLSQSKVAVYGGEQVTIEGANFGTSTSVQIGDTEAKVVSSNDTEIVIETRKNEPGTFEVKVLGTHGYSISNKKLNYKLVIIKCHPLPMEPC